MFVCVYFLIIVLFIYWLKINLSSWHTINHIYFFTIISKWTLFFEHEKCKHEKCKHTCCKSGSFEACVRLRSSCSCLSICSWNRTSFSFTTVCRNWIWMTFKKNKTVDTVFESESLRLVYYRNKTIAAKELTIIWHIKRCEQNKHLFRVLKWIIGPANTPALHDLPLSHAVQLPRADVGGSCWPTLPDWAFLSAAGVPPPLREPFGRSSLNSKQTFHFHTAIQKTLIHLAISHIYYTSSSGSVRWIHY